MIYLVYISVLFAYSVILASTLLVIWSLRNVGPGSSLGKVVGSVIFALSLVSMLCTGYYSINYWAQGSFDTPTSIASEMHHNMMMEKMGAHMMNNKDMQKAGNQSESVHSH